jgi:hypothetical protein
MFLFTWYVKVKHLIYHIYCSSAEIAISTETTEEKIGVSIDHDLLLFSQ